jgi:hypothetical protein
LLLASYSCFFLLLSPCSLLLAPCFFLLLQLKKLPFSRELQQFCCIAACCWLLAAGCWLLAAGCWLLAAGLARFLLFGLAAAPDFAITMDDGQ